MTQLRVARCVRTVPFVTTPMCAQYADRPNIVVLLADGLGYADLGVQSNTDISTLDPCANRLTALGRYGHSIARGGAVR